MFLHLNDLLIILDCEFGRFESKNERIVSICVVFRRERLLWLMSRILLLWRARASSRLIFPELSLCQWGLWWIRKL